VGTPRILKQCAEQRQWDSRPHWQPFLDNAVVKASFSWTGCVSTPSLSTQLFPSQVQFGCETPDTHQQQQRHPYFGCSCKPLVLPSSSSLKSCITAACCLPTQQPVRGKMHFHSYIRPDSADLRQHSSSVQAVPLLSAAADLTLLQHRCC
jgi:hypothetical protein